MSHIVFKDVTGEITKRPGSIFNKLPSIPDSQIEFYKDHGCELVTLDEGNHYAEVKIAAENTLSQAQLKLGRVPAFNEDEPPSMSRRRTNREADVEAAQSVLDTATKQFASAMNLEKPATRRGRPRKEIING